MNLGLGQAIQNIRLLDSAASDLTAITGQKPVVTRARKSIAGFKLRQGMPIGVMVTLRGTGCSSSWIGSSISACPEFAIFEESLPMRSTDRATIRSESGSI